MIKKFFFTLTMLLTVSVSFAQISDGYYRLKSAKTGRYAVVMDNRGSVDVPSTSIDLGAIHSFRDFDGNVVANPGSIIYAHAAGDGYDLRSQGTSTYSMVGYYIKIKESRNNPGTYWAYGTKSGNTIYIGDVNTTSEEGVLVDNDGHHEWYILPVEADGDNYFGIIPSCEVAGKYYHPFYAAFPFKCYSGGMKVYYVTKYAADMAVLKEYNGETKPASMPMIIECSSPESTNNRLDLFTNSPAVASDNILTGTYFNNEWPSNHWNRVENDPETIRLLGVTSTGKLGFVTKTDVDYVPANTAYLKVTPGTAAELRLVSEDEFTAGVSEITVDDEVNAPSGVYTLTGVKVADDANANLPAGVYIINGKKVVVR